jgi:nucleotide-binding universal stress UspA family protein
MIRRILVPLDYSPASLRALDYAVELARVFGAELVVLHAVEVSFLPAPGDTYGPRSNMEKVFREFERAAREHVSRIAAQLDMPPGKVRTIVRRGNAGRLIVDGAKRAKADLIVMSTEGRSGLAHAFLGSVAEKVVRTALCPVLTVRARKRVRREPRSRR